MEHFIRVVMEKQDTLAEGLNEDVFPGSEVMETEQGATVFNIPLPNALSEQESDEFADRLVNYMTEQGYDDFTAGYFNTTSAINAIQYKFESGNIDSGTIKLYGIKDS